MSIGSIRELTRACLEKFAKMAKDIPKSEKKEIIKVYQKYVNILEGI